MEMKLARSLWSGLRTFLEDLFNEDIPDEGNPAGVLTSRSLSVDAPSQELLYQTLAQAQSRLDALHVELTNAIARQRRTEQDLKDATAQASQISDSVDEALRDGQDDLARERMQRLLPLQKTIQELEAYQQASLKLVDLLRESIRTQQAQVDQARRKSLQLLEKERSVAVLEELAQVRRDLNHQVSAVQAELDKRQDGLSLRQDRTASRLDSNQHM
jgi:phage shock protein A